MKNSGADTTASRAMKVRAQQNKFNQVEGQAPGSLGISFELEQAKDRLRNANENGDPKQIELAEKYIEEVRARKNAQAFNEVEGEAEGPMNESFYLERDKRQSPLVDTVASQAMEERKRVQDIAERAASAEIREEESGADEKVA